MCVLLKVHRISELHELNRNEWKVKYRSKTTHSLMLMMFLPPQNIGLTSNYALLGANDVSPTPKFKSRAVSWNHNTWNLNEESRASTIKWIGNGEYFNLLISSWKVSSLIIVVVILNTLNRVWRIFSSQTCRQHKFSDVKYV